MSRASWLRVVAFLFSCAAASSTQAQTSRTWVSGVGDDLNPCSRTAPCKTFAGAISKTAAKGEINVLDAGGFGSVTITKSISIVGEGATAGILAAGTNGIVINAAATDNVVLRGLDLEGFGTGLNGIRVLSAASVTVENCTINGFSQEGIEFTPSAAGQLVVRHSEIRNNPAAAGGGILVRGSAAGTATAYIEDTLLTRNFYGLRAEDFSKVDVRRSAAIGNINNGFWAFGAGNAISLNVEASQASLNGVSGVRSEGAATIVRLSDSTVTNNGVAGLVAGSGGQLLSFGNNRNAGNPSAGVPTGTLTQQ